MKCAWYYRNWINSRSGYVNLRYINIMIRALYHIAIYRLYRYFGYMIHIVSFILVTRYFKWYILAIKLPMKFVDLSIFFCLKLDKMYRWYISNIASCVSWYVLYCILKKHYQALITIHDPSSSFHLLYSCISLLQGHTACPCYNSTKIETFNAKWDSSTCMSHAKHNILY